MWELNFVSCTFERFSETFGSVSNVERRIVEFVDFPLERFSFFRVDVLDWLIVEFFAHLIARFHHLVGKVVELRLDFRYLAKNGFLDCHIELR